MGLLETLKSQGKVAVHADFRSGKLVNNVTGGEDFVVGGTGFSWAGGDNGYGLGIYEGGTLATATNAGYNALRNFTVIINFVNKFVYTNKTQRFISKRNASGSSFEVFTNGDAYVRFSSTAIAASDASIRTAGKKSLAFSITDGAVMKVYGNGVFASDSNVNCVVSNINCPIYLGSLYLGIANNENPIAEIVITNEVLSAADILTLYNEFIASQRPTVSPHASFSYPVPQKTADAVGFWDMSAGKTGTILDLAGSNNLTVTNYGSEKNAYPCAAFCGQKMTARKTNPTGLPVGGQLRTVEYLCWTENTTLKSFHVIDYGDGLTGNQDFIVIQNGSAPNTGFTDGLNVPNVTSFLAPVLRKWIHVAFVIESTTTYKLYYDGALMQSGTFAVPIDTVATPTELNIGNRQRTTEFPLSGKLAYVGITNTAWTAEQVSARAREVLKLRFQNDLTDSTQTPSAVTANKIGNTEFVANGTSSWNVDKNDFLVGNGFVSAKCSNAYGTKVYKIKCPSIATCVLVQFITNEKVLGRDVADITTAGYLAYDFIIGGGTPNFVRFRHRNAGALTLLDYPIPNYVLGDEMRVAITRDKLNVFKFYVWIAGVWEYAGTATDASLTTCSYQQAKGTSITNSIFACLGVFDSILTIDDLNKKFP